MREHNFILNNTDTDSIMISKPNGEIFTSKERIELLNEINSSLPEYIKFSDDGYYPSVLIFKAKNYVLLDENEKIKYKGSSLKSSTLEPALKMFIDECVKSLLLKDNKDELIDIYHKYVKIILTDINKDNIKQWSSKKTLTEKVYNSKRLNETKLLNAIENAEYSPGDKVFVFFDQEDNLILIENFKEGCYNINRLLKKLYLAAMRFEPIMDCSVFKNYSLKKNKKDLSLI